MTFSQPTEFLSGTRWDTKKHTELDERGSRLVTMQFEMVKSVFWQMYLSSNNKKQKQKQRNIYLLELMFKNDK